MSSTENLIKVKQALAEKYTNLARIAGSTPKRKTFMYRAERFRRQVRALQGKS